MSDAGSGIEDPLVGQLRPSPTDLGGRGVWLTRMMADAVEVVYDGSQNTVTIHAATETAV